MYERRFGREAQPCSWLEAWRHVIIRLRVDSSNCLKNNVLTCFGISDDAGMIACKTLFRLHQLLCNKVSVVLICSMHIYPYKIRKD